MSSTFSAHREISSTPHATTIISVDHLDDNWQIYAQIEFVIRSGRVLRIYPSIGAVHEHLVDKLVMCAIAYRDGVVTEIRREKQPSWGIVPDLVFYVIPESAMNSSG
jgi:hypothetical protein